MRIALNLRLLFALLAAFGVSGAGVHFLHEAQVRRCAGAWLRQAELARDQADWGLYLEYLGRYLAAEPADADALAEYGLTLAKNASDPKTRWQVMGILGQALTRRPEREDVRRTLAETALSLGRLADAREHLEMLLQARPYQGEVEFLLGECLEAAGELLPAAERYEQAVQHAPGLEAAYARWADLLAGRLDAADQARVVLDRLVAANDRSFRAYLLRARFAAEQGEADAAARDVARARQLAPTEPDVVLAVARLDVSAHPSAQTGELLRQCLKEHPRHPPLYQALAELEARSGRPQEAVAGLRAGLKVLPDQPDLLEFLGELLIRQGDVAGAAEVIARLPRSGPASARTWYWEAQLCICRKEWARAIVLLTKAGGELTDAAWQKQIALALGRCYGPLGDAPRQLAALRQAVAADPSCETRLELGNALLGQGKTDEAVEEFRQATGGPTASGQAWTALAQALLLRKARLEPSRRQWTEVEAALDRAASGSADAVSVLLLRANVMASRGETEQARRFLDLARTKFTQRPEIPAALAELTARSGRLREALADLDEAEKRLGPRLELAIARVNLLPLEDRVARSRDLAALEAGVKRLPAADQAQLAAALAETAFRLGDRPTAERLYTRWAASDPGDLRPRLRLAEIWWETGNEAALTGLVREIREIEGEGGAEWRCEEAELHFLRARRGEPNDLAEAERLLAQAAALRPNWDRVPLLQGTLAELEGKADKALEAYLRALELGNRQPGVGYHLVQRLHERRRDLEADDVVHKLEESGPLSPQLARLAAEVALANHDLAGALKRAGQAVPPGSRDYRDRLWLAGVQEATGKIGEADQTFQSVVRQSPRVPEVWAARVEFLVRTRRAAAAEQAVRQARENLPPAQAPLALLRCYEALGRTAPADEQAGRALASGPDDGFVLRQVAGYYLRSGRPALAEPLLRKMTAAGSAAFPEQTAWARRHLAELRIRREDERALAEALDLLDQNRRETLETATDLSLRARAVAARPDGGPEAMRLLEAAQDKQPLGPDDLLLLARLYEAADDRARAREQLLSLVAAHRDNADYLATYVRSLVRWGETEEARPWLARLKVLEPGSTRSTELQKALADRGSEYGKP